MSQSNKRTIFYLTFLGAIFLLLGLINLWKFNEIDQSNLMTDARRFWAAVTAFDWVGTHVSTRTGVLVFWLVGIIKTVASWLGFNDIFLLVRIGLFLFRLSLIPLIFKLITKLTEWKVGALVVLYVLISPMVFAGLNVTWLDKFVILLGFITVLSWLVYLKDEKVHWLITTGIFLGLSILTKPVGMFYIVMLASVLLWRRLFSWNYLNKFFLVLIIAFSIFYSLYPAMWLEPIHTMFSRYGNNSGTLEVSIGGDGTGSLLFYPEQILKTDVVLAMGVMLFVYESIIFLKKRTMVDDLWKLAFAGAVYLTMVMAVSMILRDEDTGPGALFSVRYLAPAIPIFAAYMFARLQKVRVKVKQIIIFVVFGITLLRFDLVAHSLKILIDAYFS